MQSSGLPITSDGRLLGRLHDCQLVQRPSPISLVVTMVFRCENDGFRDADFTASSVRAPQLRKDEPEVSTSVAAAGGYQSC